MRNKKILLVLLIILITSISYNNKSTEKNNLIKKINRIQHLESNITSIKINQSNLILEVNEKNNLSISSNEGEINNTDVNWSSSDTTIATVDNNGIVTAIGIGTAKIIAVSKNDPSINDTCIVTVKKSQSNTEASATNQNIKVTKIEFSKHSFTVKKGTTGTLKVAITPSNASNKIVKFVSSDDSVVKIDENGKIETLKEGKAVILAISLSDSNITDTCTITVKNGNVQATEITLNKNYISLNIGTKSKIEAILNPTDATTSIKWESSDTKIVKVSQDGTIKAVGVGSATITAKAGTLTSSCTVNVTSANTKKFLETLEKMSDQVKKDTKKGKKWKYGWKGHSDTFAQAKKGNRKLTCILMPTWALIDMGILKPGQVFGNRMSKKETYTWYKGNKDTKKRIKKYFKIINAKGKTPEELEKTGDLQPGDIILWKTVEHTNVYAGNKTWYDSGTKAVRDSSKKYFTSRIGFGPLELENYYENKKVRQILRFKI